MTRLAPLAVAAWLGVAMFAPLAGAQTALETFDAPKVSAEIANYLAKRDIDAAAAAGARLMEGTKADKLKDVFQLVTGLGQSQYTDMVYAREFGKSEKDVIYKIDYDKAFLFVRFLYHVDNGAWRLIHIHLKTENEETFPKEWAHIYPK
jgi:hypothetical protein